MKEVASIQYEQKVMEKESQKKMSQIEDEAYIAQMKAKADAAFYTAEREASANKVRYQWISVTCVCSDGLGFIYCF